MYDITAEQRSFTPRNNVEKNDGALKGGKYIRQLKSCEQTFDRRETDVGMYVPIES